LRRGPGQHDEDALSGGETSGHLIDSEARSHQGDPSRESVLRSQVARYNKRTRLEILADAAAEHLSGVSERYRVEPGDGEIETVTRSDGVTLIPAGMRCAMARNSTGLRPPVCDRGSCGCANQHNERPSGCQRRPAPATPLFRSP